MTERAKTPYEPLPLDRPFDPEEHLRNVPENNVVRGLFFHALRDAYLAGGLEPPRVPKIAFSFYPERQYAQLQLDAARALHAGKALARGLFELGRCVYPAFAQSMVGTAIFAFAGSDFSSMAKLAPRAYDVSVGDAGRVKVLHAEPGLVHAQMNGVWDFMPFTFGVWRGGMDVVGIRDCEMKHYRHAPGCFEMLIRW